MGKEKDAVVTFEQNGNSFLNKTLLFHFCKDENDADTSHRATTITIAITEN